MQAMDGKRKGIGLKLGYRKRCLISPYSLRSSADSGDEDYEPTLLRKIIVYNGKEEDKSKNFKIFWRRGKG